MSGKKSFSISKGLAAGIKSSIASATTTTNQGQLHYDMMAIDAIEPDPMNPRKLLITKDELFNGINKSDPYLEAKTKELNALNDLAESIKKVGIRNAIEVYKEGDKYRIISGERRYLAATLAGEKSVPARVNQKLDELKLRYIQWIENINREDLSLWERYNNLVSISDAYRKANNASLNSETLKEVLGVASAQSYRYLSLLNAEQDILDLVKSGKLTSLKLIHEIAGKDKTTKQRLLEEIRNKNTAAPSFNKFKTAKEKKNLSKKSISLGKIHHSNTAKCLFDVILRDTRISKYHAKFDAIDWNSVRAINKAFKDLLKIVEKEFNKEEMTNGA